MSLAQAFADAFNARDIDAMVRLLSDDATAEVLRSGFPVEVGKEAIRTTSFPYLLEGGELRGVAVSEALVFLCNQVEEVDVIVRLEGGGVIESIEYLVTGFSRGEMVEVAGQFSLGVVGDFNAEDAE